MQTVAIVSFGLPIQGACVTSGKPVNGGQKSVSAIISPKLLGHVPKLHVGGMEGLYMEHVSESTS